MRVPECQGEKKSDCSRPRGCQAKAVRRKLETKQSKTICSAFCKWSVGLVSLLLLPLKSIIGSHHVNSSCSAFTLQKVLLRPSWAGLSAELLHACQGSTSISSTDEAVNVLGLFGRRGNKELKWGPGEGSDPQAELQLLAWKNSVFYQKHWILHHANLKSSLHFFTQESG